MESSPKNTLLLRIAIAFSFLYPAIDAVFHPDAWISFFPKFMRTIVPDPTLLYVWGILEVIVAIWILFGRRIFIPALVATVALVLIVLCNLSAISIVFRDIALALVAATLALWSYRKDR